MIWVFILLGCHGGQPCAPGGCGWLGQKLWCTIMMTSVRVPFTIAAETSSVNSSSCVSQDLFVFSKAMLLGGTGCHLTSGVATCMMELTRIWACAKRCSQWHLLYLWTCTDPQDYLFHCMAYLTEETLKRNKSSYKQAEYQRTYQKDEKHCFFSFGDAKWLPKNGTLWHYRLSFVLMLTLHRHVQLMCYPKTKNKLPFW